MNQIQSKNLEINREIGTRCYQTKRKTSGPLSFSRWVFTVDRVDNNRTQCFQLMITSLLSVKPRMKPGKGLRVAGKLQLREPGGILVQLSNVQRSNREVCTDDGSCRRIRCETRGDKVQSAVNPFSVQEMRWLRRLKRRLKIWRQDRNDQEIVLIENLLYIKFMIYVKLIKIQANCH